MLGNLKVWNSDVKKESRYLISQLLKDMNLTWMSNLAKDELNVEILKGYVRLLEFQAIKYKNTEVMIRLYKANFINLP